MTIKSESFNAAKNVMKIDFRKNIQLLMKELASVSEENMGTSNDRSIYANYANRQNAQFMGYLIVDHKRDYIADTLNTKIPMISDEERKLLKTANSIIQEINKKCVEDLVSEIPSLSLALNPYSLFEYPQNHGEIDASINIKAFDPLIDAVKKSEISKLINSIPKELSQKIPADKYLGISVEFANRIRNKGVHDIPEDFKTLIIGTKVNSPEYIVQKLMFSVMCLREIISNIDQMIYQAFTKTKLVMLDENNIISHDKNTTHFVGKGLTISVQPVKDELFTHVGDLVIYNIESPGYKDEGIGSVEGLNISFSQEWGNTQIFKIRVLDDNLNPFFNLIRPEK